MNARIKELAEEAEVYVNERVKRSKGWCDESIIKIRREKFAELIAADIHKKVIASILITDVIMEEKGQVPTSEDYIRAINEDFGVI